MAPATRGIARDFQSNRGHRRGRGILRCIDGRNEQADLQLRDRRRRLPRIRHDLRRLLDLRRGATDAQDQEEVRVERIAPGDGVVRYWRGGSTGTARDGCQRFRYDSTGPGSFRGRYLRQLALRRWLLDGSPRLGRIAGPIDGLHLARYRHRHRYRFLLHEEIFWPCVGRVRISWSFCLRGDNRHQDHCIVASGEVGSDTLYCSSG